MNVLMERESNDNSVKTDSAVMNILLVDDCDANLMLLEKFMEMTGCGFKFAGNGKEALEKLSAERFDLVLMDCVMPEVTGYEAVRVVRESGKNYSEIPIICMSSKHQEFSTGIDPMCRRCKVNGFLHKPLKGTALLEILGRYSPAGGADKGNNQVEFQSVEH